MSKLGTKEKPAVVRVQTQERGAQIMELANAHGWQAIVGIEPDNTENIDDIKKLQRDAKPEPKFNNQPSRNAPCPCGSGKQFKRCCGK